MFTFIYYIKNYSIIRTFVKAGFADIILVFVIEHKSDWQSYALISVQVNTSIQLSFISANDKSCLQLSAPFTAIAFNVIGCHGC